MTLVRLTGFLVSAFERIDASHKLHGAQELNSVAHVVEELFSPHKHGFSVKLRGSTLVVETNSPILKHKIYTSQGDILRRLAHTQVRSITFTPQKL